MFKKLQQICVAAAFAVGSVAATAGPITGSISPTDGFNPAVIGGLSIVSQLTQINIGSPSVVQQPGGATGDLVGAITFVIGNFYSINSFGFDLNDPNGPGDGGTLIYSGNGFSFYLTGISDLVRTALSCTGNNCKDQLAFDWTGFITGPGFDATTFEGSWTGNGACFGSVTGGCVRDTTASWSSSIVSNGVLKVPEPATLALLGIGLLGIGFARRRKS